VDLVVAGAAFGVVVGAILALAAVGFTLQYSVTNVFNLAFTETMVVAGFVALWAERSGTGLWVAAVSGVAAGAVISVLLNKLVYQPFIRRGMSLFGMIIISLAMSLVLANLLLAVVGPLSFGYDVRPSVVVTVGAARVTDVQTLVLVTAVVAMAAIHVLLRASRIGKAMRAASVDAGLAQSCGVPTGRIVTIAWLVSGALCGLAGVTYFLSSSTFSATSGRTFIVLVLAAAVLGGIGDAYGAMLGGLVIGLATELGAIWFDPSYKVAIALLVLLGVLLWRPQGIRAEFAHAREMQA
jgi:branched-subunit amino acid ABC-type transport system permease component